MISEIRGSPQYCQIWPQTKLTKRTGKILQQARCLLCMWQNLVQSPAPHMFSREPEESYLRQHKLWALPGISKSQVIQRGGVLALPAARFNPLDIPSPSILKRNSRVQRQEKCKHSWEWSKNQPIKCNQRLRPDSIMAEVLGLCTDNQGLILGNACGPWALVGVIP